MSRGDSFLGAIDQGTGSSRFLVSPFIISPADWAAPRGTRVHVARTESKALATLVYLGWMCNPHFQLFDEQCQVVSKHQVEVEQFLPKEG